MCIFFIKNNRINQSLINHSALMETSDLGILTSLSVGRNKETAIERKLGVHALGGSRCCDDIKYINIPAFLSRSA